MANDDLKEKLKLLSKIEEIYKFMGKANPFSSIDAATYSLAEMNFALSESKEELLAMDGSIGDIAGSMRSVVDEVGGYNNSLAASKRALGSINSISEKLKDHTKGTNTLNTEGIEKLKQKAAAEHTRLLELQKSLEAQKESIKNDNTQTSKLIKIVEQLNNINGVLDKNGGNLIATNDELQRQLDIQKNIDKELGFYPSLLGGIDRVLKRMGMPDLGINQALIETRALVVEADNIGEKLHAFPTFMGLLKDKISASISPANILQGAFTILVATLKELDSTTGEFAKAMNMTYSESLQVRNNMLDIASSTHDVSVNSKLLQETYMAVGKALGVNAQLNEKDLVTMTKLTHQAGLQYDELMNIQKLSLVYNKSLEDNTKEILGATSAFNAKNKLALNEKEILKDVNNMSASLKLSLGGSAINMAEAAAKAREFGINLQQAEAISQSLLNFESSIENELSAELITGQALNLERARGLALSGDTAAASAEILKQVGSAADFGKMNVIQQEAIAKAMGMQRNELAQSLIDKEALVKMGVKSDSKSLELYKQLKAEGISEGEIKKRLGEQGLKDMEAQQSAQERLNDSVMKMKEIFVSIAEPILNILNPLIEMIGVIAESKVLFSSILGIMAGMKAMQIASAVLRKLKIRDEQKILALKAGQATASFIINPIAAGIGAAAAIGAGALIYSKMKDGVIDPKKGPVMTGEFGSVQLDPNDKAMYGADGKIKVGTNLNPQQGGGHDLTPIISELRALRAEINKRPIYTSVQIDGKEVASATANNSQTFYNSSAPNNFKVQ